MHNPEFWPGDREDSGRRNGMSRLAKNGKNPGGVAPPG